MDFQIDYLKNHKYFVDEVSLIWCKEWSSNLSCLPKQKRAVEAGMNIKKIPFILIAYKDNELIGTAAIFYKDLDSRPYLSPWLAGVYVKEPYRGKGIATQLVNKIIAGAKFLRIERLYLHTEGTDELYKKLGWKYFEDGVTDRGEKTKIYYIDL